MAEMMRVIIDFSTEAFEALDGMRNSMDAQSYTEVIRAALGLLRGALPYYLCDGGEVTASKDGQEAELGIVYNNSKGEETYLPKRLPNDSLPNQARDFSENDKRFFKDLGIEPE